MDSIEVPIERLKYITAKAIQNTALASGEVLTLKEIFQEDKELEIVTNQLRVITQTLTKSIIITK